MVSLATWLGSLWQTCKQPCCLPWVLLVSCASAAYRSFQPGQSVCNHRIPDDYIGDDQRPRIHMLDFVSHTSSRSFGRVSWKVITLCQYMIRLDQLIQNCGNTCDRIVREYSVLKMRIWWHSIYFLEHLVFTMPSVLASESTYNISGSLIVHQYHAKLKHISSLARRTARFESCAIWSGLGSWKWWNGFHKCVTCLQNHLECCCCRILNQTKRS